MTAGLYDIVIEQGATFRRVIVARNKTTNALLDLTGCTAEMQVRSSVDASASLLTLSTTNGRITLGGTAGTITLEISKTDTAAITFERGVYDFELTLANGKVDRLFEGRVFVSKEVTR